MSFPLHQQVIADADDLAITQAVSACIAELRRRALLSPSYNALAEAVAKNAVRNAANRAAGFDEDGLKLKGSK
ncbi:MAG: hypothetical protein Q7T13_01565 [Polaromonas sp.]|nr:hypothetical protein [Polaromonas sp.]